MGLLKCFVDIMPMQPNQRTLIEPFELFREGFEQLPPPLLPSSFAEMDLIGAMSKSLTLGNEGIVFDYLRYNSYELQDLRRAYSHSCKTLVKYHPEDLDFVYIQDPSSKDWLMVPSCQPEYTQSLSIVQHHAIRRHKKGELNKRNAAEKLMEGKVELIDMYDAFLRGNRSKKNVEVAQKFGTLTSTQTLISTSTPRKLVVPESALVLPSEDLSKTRKIPVFSGFQLD